MARLLAICAAAIGTAPAEPPQGPSAQCTQGGMTDHAFPRQTRGRAEYRFAGACSTRDGDALVYRLTGTWTPAATGDPAAANASEVFQVDRASGASESFTGVVGYRCPDDPWLHDVQCTRVGADLPPAIGQFWRQLAAGDTPTSRHGVPAAQRGALVDDYRRANGWLTLDARADQRVPDDRLPLPGRGIRLSSGASVPARRVGIVELNPQPLPPVDDGDAPARDDHATTGIIIVGGKPIAAKLPRAAPGAPAMVAPVTGDRP